jgi:hypothetical protein
LLIQYFKKYCLTNSNGLAHDKNQVSCWQEETVRYDFLIN